MRTENEAGSSVAEEKTIDSGSVIALGISFGFMLGLLLDNIGLGMATGLSLATLVNAYNEKQQNIENAGIAFAVSVGGVVIVVLLWIASAMGWF